jgi:hypothetical protein
MDFLQQHVFSYYILQLHTVLMNIILTDYVFNQAYLIWHAPHFL